MNDDAPPGPVVSSLAESRREQMFPKLAIGEIERLRRFGQARSFAPGGVIESVGEAGHGLTVVLAGEVAVTWVNEAGERLPVGAYHAGHFLGELAQLSGRPALVGKRPMSRVSRAIEKGETSGFMKVIVDAETRRILGAAVLGTGGDEVIPRFWTSSMQGHPIRLSSAPCIFIQPFPN